MVKQPGSKLSTASRVPLSSGNSVPSKPTVPPCLASTPKVTSWSQRAARAPAGGFTFQPEEERARKLLPLRTFPKSLAGQASFLSSHCPELGRSHNSLPERRGDGALLPGGRSEGHEPGLPDRGRRGEWELETAAEQRDWKGGILER